MSLLEPTLAELVAAIDAVARATPAGDDPGLVAAELMSRMRAGAEHRRRTGRAHPVFGDGAVATAAPIATTTAARGATAFLSAGAAVFAAWRDSLPSEGGGAP